MCEVNKVIQNCDYFINVQSLMLLMSTAGCGFIMSSFASLV